MATHFISESRIRSQRFYTVMRESKIRFYTTSVAAARYWVKNCSEAPPLALNGAEMATEVSAEEASSPAGDSATASQDLQSKPAEEPPAAKV
jgi:hypothetical protein